MNPKYAVGNKVRIKSRDILERTLSPEIQLYENMVGEIMEATNVVAFIEEPGPDRPESTHITIYHYTVKINEQVILHDVYEECLELVT